MIQKEIMLENRQEVERQHVVKRDIVMEDFANYVLIGVRRAGKSFLLYQQIQQYLSKGLTCDSMLYVNFEDERLIGMTAQELNLILEVHGTLSDKRPILFPDEIQNISGWEKFARRLADSKYRVYITGSNAKMLSSDVATTSGRAEIQRLFAQYFRFGGFPEGATLPSKRDCKRMIILTYEAEETVTIDDRDIEVIPVWKWLIC